MLYAIHVHPHDIRDEGAERVVENITELGKIKTIIAEAMTLEERHPYPDGVLPHNPRHSVVVSRATLEVPLSGRLFSGLSIQPVPSAEVLAGNDYIGLLRKAAAVGGATVIPWVKGLNGAFSGRIEDLSVKTLDGQPVPTWLCPSRPETFEYIASLIEGILDRYPSEAILLDRMRYPDWSGANVQPERMLTCFCDSCCRMMEDEGIDLALLKSVLKRFLKQPDQPGGRFQNLSGAELNEIRKWLGFRAALITRLVDRVSTQVKIYNQTRHMNTKFWLNLWPPSFAWFLGQDYQALGRLCDGAKHFPYHRLGGGDQHRQGKLAAARLHPRTGCRTGRGKCCACTGKCRRPGGIRRCRWSIVVKGLKGSGQRIQEHGLCSRRVDEGSEAECALSQPKTSGQCGGAILLPRVDHDSGRGTQEPGWKPGTGRCLASWMHAVLSDGRLGAAH